MGLSNFELKKRDEHANEAVNRYGDTLWHYTDINALNGILNQKEIWFGSAANMNDKNELRGFIDDLKKEVLLYVNKKNMEKAEAVFKRINQRMILEYPFLFCVSRAKNDAAQWERYANNGQGLAIVFNTEALVKLTFYNQLIMNEEYYGYNAKQHQMCNLLVDYIQKDKLVEFSDLEGLIDNLLVCAMVHKHESFVAEQEIRIAPYFVKDGDSHLQYKIMGTIKRVYVLKLDELCKKEGIDFEDLIETVVIGPKSQQNIEDLKWYCNQIGLSKIANKIYISNCPLR